MRIATFMTQAASYFSSLTLVILSLSLAVQSHAQPGFYSEEEEIDKVYFVLKENPKSSGQTMAEYWVGDCSVPECRIKVFVDDATKIENYDQVLVDVTALQKYKYYQAEYINFVPLNAVVVKSIKLDI